MRVASLPIDLAGTVALARLPARRRAAGRRLELTRAVVPLPPEDGHELSGYDPEVREALRALGYAVGDEDDDKDDAH